jgi:hypothetical protein
VLQSHSGDNKSVCLIRRSEDEVYLMVELLSGTRRKTGGREGI